MKISEFKKQPRGAYSFDTWHWKRGVPSPLGKFRVELLTHDRKAPDDEMLRRAADLIQYAEAHGDFILEVVHQDYRQHAKDRQWLKCCQVPADLAKDKVAKYIASKPCLRVSRSEIGDPYSSRVSITPRWNEEHGIGMDFLNDALYWEHGVRVKVRKYSNKR